MIQKSEKIILQLIRKALCPEYPIDTTIFANAPWAEVIETATEQGVLGICFEALEQLDASCRPDMDNLMDWLGQVEYMKTCYEEHRRVIGELGLFYQEQSIRMMLLKGYGLSLYWPAPEHRPVGDIDIYLGHLWQFGDQMVRSDSASR